MAASDVIIVPIPPNQDLLPGTVPTNPATRLTSDDLILEPAKESDLLTIVTIPRHSLFQVEQAFYHISRFQILNLRSSKSSQV